MTEHIYKDSDFEFKRIRGNGYGMQATCRHCEEWATGGWEAIARQLVQHTQNCVLLMAAGDAQRSVRK